MAGIQDYWEFCDDFWGTLTLPTSAGDGPWLIDDTSTGGTPTYGAVDGSECGEVQLVLASNNEIENVGLHFGDVLCFDIDKIRGFECRLKMNQAAMDATSQLAFGLIGDRNDAIDSIAQAALFRVIGGDSTTAVVVESDDGTNDNNDVATGETLINAYKKFKIDFSQGKSDVRFYMDGADGALKRVAAGTTFDMSNYSGALQPLFQLQKTADTNTDGVTLDYVKIWGVR